MTVSTISNAPRNARHCAPRSTQFRPTTAVRTNIYESNNGFKLDLRLAGWNKEEIKIESKDRNLTVSGVVKESEASDYKIKSLGFRKSNFMKSYVLPEYADLESIKASFTNGILSIIINKVEGHELKKEIKIS